MVDVGKIIGSNTIVSINYEMKSVISIIQGNSIMTNVTIVIFQWYY
jgi:hypothetical protein